MQLVTWQFQNLKIPMVKTADGQLYCTTQEVYKALGIDKNHLWKLKHDYPTRIQPICLTESKVNGTHSSVLTFLQG